MTTQITAINSHLYVLVKSKIRNATFMTDPKCVNGWEIAFSVYFLHLLFNLFSQMLTSPDPEMFQMQEGGKKLYDPIYRFLRFYPHVCECNHVPWRWLIFIVMDETRIGFQSRNTRWDHVAIQQDKLQIFLFCALVNKAGDLQQLPVCLCTSAVTMFYENKCWLWLSVLEVSWQLLQHKAASVDRRLKSALIDGSHLLCDFRQTNEMAQQICCCTRTQM